jgi:hypothetical protein
MPGLCTNPSIYRRHRQSIPDSRPHKGTNGRISIIEKHKSDDPSHPLDPEPAAALKIQTSKTKKAQPFSGAAPFSAIK